jgi:hypothetical protein
MRPRFRGRQGPKGLDPVARPIGAAAGDSLAFHLADSNVDLFVDQSVDQFGAQVNP